MEAPSVAAIQRTLEEANFFHSAGSVRLEEGSSKRRLLTAVDSVAAGTTIGHIVPLIAVQNPLSTARSLSCSRCALNCGQVGLLIDFVAGDLSRQDAVAQLCSSGEGVCCTQGCGTLYCSATCRDADFEMHHRLLCVGLLEDAEHPLYQFKISAMQSGFFEIIHLAAQLISFFVAAETTVVHDGVPIDFDALCSQTMPHLRAVAGFAAGEEHDEDYFTVRDQCFRLLRDGLALSHNIDLETCFGGGALTSTFFAQVCEYLRRWGTVVELPSSLIDHSASLMDTFADDSAALDREVQRLKRVLKVLADEGLAAESDEEEDYSSVDGSNDDDSNASDAGKRDEEQGGGRIAEEELGVGRSGHRIGSGGGGGGGLGRSGASVSSDRSESTESEADNSRSLWDAVTSDDLVCDARKRFDGLKGFSGMALFPFAARVRHACSPLAELEMSLADASESVTRGGGSGGGAGGSAGAVDMTPGHLGLRATLTAAGQLNPNDEVTLCHITSAYDGDLSDDVAGRTQAITALGAPESVLQCISSGVGKDAQCACSKCQVQKGLADSVSVGELRGLLQRDLRQSNFADAGAILDSIAKRNADGQDDPETLYMRARIASWKGRWNAAERLWEVAASRFPRHAKFATVLAHRDHYARVASAPSPADVALSSNAQQFKVDDYVEARWKGQWVGGRVACFWEEDETYNVLGPRGERMVCIEPADLRPLRRLHVGEHVEAVEGTVWGKTDFVAGEIVKVHNNSEGNSKKNQSQLYDVKFQESGEVEELVDRALIRLPQPKATAVKCSKSRSIFLHKEPILSPEECDAIISETEAIAEERGWGTLRHYAVPTTAPLIAQPDDIPIAHLPKTFPPFKKKLFQKVLPAMATLFDIDESKLRPLDIFVVKYTGDNNGRRHLGVHCDQSTQSFVISLSSEAQGDFAGGGTYFVETHNTINPEKGHMVSFDGSLYHAGRAVTAGTRYIIAGFLYSLS